MARLAVSFTVALGLVACGEGKKGKDDGGDGGPTPQPPPGGSGAELAPSLGVDFAHVAGFVIGPALGASLDGGATTDVLYTLTDDGTLEVTTITTTPPPVDPSTGGTGTGTATTTTVTDVAKPLGVYATPKYVFFKYQLVSYKGKDCGYVAARKADAALFCVDLQPHQGPALETELVADATGDSVYIYGMPAAEAGKSPQGFSLFRLDLTDPANPKQQVVFDGATDGSIQEWLVNPAGDVLIRLLPPGQNDTTQTAVLRAYKRAGGYVSEAQGHLDCLTEGADGAPNDFHYIQDANDPNGIKATVFRLKSEDAFTAPGGVAFEEVQRTGPDGANDDPVGIGACSSHTRAGGDVFITTAYTANGKAVTKLIDLVSKDGAPPVAVPVPAFDGGKITRAYGSPATLVVAGTSSTGSTGLARYDLAAKTVATLVEPGTYDITTVAVGEGGAVTFGGRRAADNARIVGTIAAGSSEVKVVAQALSRDVTAIVQIK